MSVFSKVKRALDIAPKRRRRRSKAKSSRKRRTPPRGKNGRFKKR